MSKTELLRLLSKKNFCCKSNYQQLDMEKIIINTLFKVPLTFFIKFEEINDFSLLREGSSFSVNKDRIQSVKICMGDNENE